MNNLAFEEAMSSISNSGVSLSIGSYNCCCNDHDKYIMLHNL